MSLCRECGASLRDGARFCGACGAVLAAPVTAPLSAKKQAVAEHRPAPPVGAPPPSRDRSIAAVAVVAVIAIVLLGLGAFVLIGGSDEDVATGGTSVAPSSDAGADARDEDADGSGAIGASSSSTRHTTTSTTVDPAAPGGFSGEWVAMFISYFTEAEARGYLPSAPPGSSVLHSDDYTSLRPGYWVVYRSGFDSGRAAADYCVSIGRVTAEQCYGRFLTTDPAADAADPRFKVDP